MPQSIANPAWGARPRRGGATGVGPGRLLRNSHFLLFWADSLASLGLAVALYGGIAAGRDSNQPFVYGVVVGAALLSYCIFAKECRLYDWRVFQSTGLRPWSAIQVVVLSFGLVLGTLFVLDHADTVSHLWGLCWVLGVCLWIAGSRVLLRPALARAGRAGLAVRRAVVIGAGPVGRQVLARLRDGADPTVEGLGLLDDRAGGRRPAMEQCPVMGDTGLTGSLIRRDGLDVVILALPWSAQTRIDEMVRRLSRDAVDIWLAPDPHGPARADRPVVTVSGLPMLILKERPIAEWQAVGKRMVDLGIAVPMVLLLAPLLALVAVAIRLESPGPVLFRQDRLGRNNTLISVLKFRSMAWDRRDAAGHCLTRPDDPRVTRVGRLIRRTSIDELPQLFNVIAGSMSLVGPRPHAVQARAGDTPYPAVVADYASRHRVKPGMTGWAQCNGWRGETDTREKLVRRVEHDLYYIEHWSLWLDLVILARTVVRLARGDRNAY